MFMYIPKVVFFLILFALLTNKYLKIDALSLVFILIRLGGFSSLFTVGIFARGA